MTFLLWILGIYLIVAILAFTIQGLAKLLMGNDTDQTPMKWSKVLKYALQWPLILIRFAVR